MFVEYLDLLEKAKERDHGKLGVELDLYFFKNGQVFRCETKADLRFN